MTVCEACEEAATRWACEVCGEAVCSSTECIKSHESTCKRAAEPETTVGLLELALLKEPFKNCSARPRCAACEKHDVFRDKIEVALKAAREFRAS